MLQLVLQNLRHIARTRLLLLVLVFSLVLHYGGVKVVRGATFYFQGVMATIDFKDALFVSLLFQLFTGGFLAAVYGIWMVPYAHSGPRASLTFTLPLSKWKFPAAYAVAMLLLLLVQFAVMFFSFGLNYGFDAFQNTAFPWKGLVICLTLETFAFEVLMFAFASSSLWLGQVPTFFVGAICLGAMQLFGIVFRLDVDRYLGKYYDNYYWAQTLYHKLPPIGDLVVDLRKTFVNPSWENAHLVLWTAWFFILVALLRYRLRYPAPSRGVEA